MRRLLIANRGEIACRIIRAAKALGYETVALYSDADQDALHVASADIAVHIGPSPARQSYLDVDRVLQVGREQQVDGVHPGYGFLSENTEFAQKAEAAGITWIGPDSDTIAQMGDKNRARDIACACHVPVLPGSGRIDTDHAESILAQAQQVGYPLLVKATGGGGGIGMRLVESPDALLDTVSRTLEVAAKSFGDGGVYLERYVPRGRHIEIQVFGFGDGTAVHLYERECSVQRRFQKVLEESPAPGLPASVLEKMCEAAVALASYQRYAGPGTVEFLVDAQTFEFFFLEMNTRIQVEHGVTEMITEVDLVQAQILQAFGELQPMQQSDIQRSGAAVECRIYAENPARNFMPSPGTLTQFVLPEPNPWLRVDTGVRQGDKITPFYDPMIAKVIVWGESRAQALLRLQNALEHTQIEGIHTNLVFLRQLVQHPDFVAGNIDTQFVRREIAVLLATPVQPAVTGVAHA